MRRSLAVLASIGLGIGSIALAGSAQATTVQVEITDGGQFLALTPNTAVATEIVFTNNSSDSAAVESPLMLLDGESCRSADCSIAVGEALSLTVAPAADGAVVFVSGPGSFSTGLFVTYSGGGDGSGSASAAPAPEIQQFGLPASGNCEDGITEAMNWSGVGLDGWGISWAQWANNGAGGAVCTRTVTYDTSSAKWVVN